MRTIFILVVIAIGFAGAVVSRQIGLLVYVWFSLFRPLEWIWTDLTSFRLSLVAGLLLLIPCVLTGKLPNVTHPLSLLAWAFFGTVVTAQYTTYFPTDWGWVDQFVRLLLVSSLAVTLVKTRDHLSQLVAVTAGSFAFFSAKAGVSALMGDGVQFGAGQAGAFVDNNGYALAVNMAMPLMAATAVTFQAPVPGLAYWRKGFIAAIPLSVITIIFTMSRAGLLALGTLAIAASLLQRRPVLWLSALTLSGGLLYAVAPLPDGYVERMQTITTYEEVGEGSALGRLHFWRVAWLMAKDNPWGVGLRRYDTVYDDYDDSNGAYGRSRSVHNSHLGVLAEVGFLGFALWILIFLYAFWVCMRIRYSAARHPGLSDDDRRYFLAMSTAFAASMAAFIVGGSFIASANNELTWLTFAMIAALDRIYRAHLRSMQPPVVVVEQAAHVIPRPRRKAIA
jgi:probable O-glycosylation ligase (exosortase A-associated)